MSSTDLVPMEAEIAQAPANLFGTANPAEVVSRSTEIAKALADVLKTRNLAKQISGRSFVLVEGWTLLGTMLGVFPVVVWTRKLTDPDGWEARVEARTLGGQVVGAAEAECLRSEKEWGPTPTRGKPKDDYALRSMAQTRATSKALRGPLGFIVELAGYSATPAEEIPEDGQALDTDAANPVVPFGKHKGKRVNDIPVEYRKWIVENFQPQSEHDLMVFEAVKDSLIPF